VFWIDAEDHDWDEVRSCTVFDEAMTPRAVALPPRSSAVPEPVARVTLDDSATATIAELEAALPATEFRAGLVAGLRAAYAPGTGMVEAFARWLEHVLGSRGLVVYDASDPTSKPFAASIFARELATGETARRAAAAGAELQARGYHSQVAAQNETLALFRLDASGRRPIRRLNGQLAAGDERLTASELEREAIQDPSRFSPNVLLRPIVQDALFPTVAYVAGPSELAYLGQLRGVYEHFGVPMPLVHPRAAATLLDSGAARFLARYDVPLAAMRRQDETALNDLLRAQIPPAVEASFQAAADAVAGGMARVIQAVPDLDPTLEGAARSTLGRMQHDLETLRGKTLQAAKRRDDTLRRQFGRTRALLFPNGHPQEREIGFVSFLNQYGPALVERLEAELPLESGRHWLVTI
jgi:bacillithiol biosynthesis cysteine-adding enzyme BshC